MGSCIDLIDSAERVQFRVAFQENAELVLDMLEVMRIEAAHSAEPEAVRFIAGVGDTMAAFLSAYRRSSATAAEGFGSSLAKG
jgi:hypothetical protein